MIDVDGLERARDQLWAEAVHRFKAGEPWWLETPELEALATAEQAARFVVDPWEGPIVMAGGPHRRQRRGGARARVRDCCRAALTGCPDPGRKDPEEQLGI